MGNKADARAVTGKVRFAFVSIFAPKANPSGKEKYSITAIIDKDDAQTMSAIQSAIDQAYEAGYDVYTRNGKGQMPDKNAVVSPIRDGDVDKEGDANFAGCWYLNASSDYRPEIVDADLNHIVDADEVYGGCYGRVSLKFYPYNAMGRKGIGVQLCNVQKLEDGNPFGTRRSARDDFA